MRVARAARRSCKYAGSLGLAMVLAGCGTGLESMPLPAPGEMSGEGFVLTAAFANVMNLPNKAKVKLNGADIGEVESIKAENFTAYVRMRISSDVPLYTGATAELRSATPLGDIFVAIRPDGRRSPGSPRLRDGDTIGLDSTASAAAVEDVLGSAALLVNGGAVRHLVTVINGAGAAVGGRGVKVAELLKNSNTLISKLNARSDQIDNALRSASDLAAMLSTRQQSLNEVMDAAAPATSVIVDNTAQMADLVETISRITGQLNRFPSLRGTDTRSLTADLNRVAAEFNKIATNPDINLNYWLRMLVGMTHSTSGPNMHASGNVAQLAWGALPDMNYPGDPGSHGADGTDWHALIGSLRYQFNLLLSRIYGPDHRPR